MTARRRSMQPPKKISRRLARAGTPAGRAGLLPVPPTLSSGPLCHWARRPGFCYKRLRQSLRARRYAPLFAFFSRNWPSCASAKLRVGYPWYRWMGAASPAKPLSRVPGSGAGSRPTPCQPNVDPPAATCCQVSGWRAGRVAFTSVLYAGACTADLCVAAVDEYSYSLERPTILVLNNANIHRAARVKARLQGLARRGLELQFLPAYSSELNQIERLWHRCKYYWLTPQDCSSDTHLHHRLVHLIAGVGKPYCITFA